MKMPDLPRLPARQRKAKPCIALLMEALLDNQVCLTRLISWTKFHRDHTFKNKRIQTACPAINLWKASTHLLRDH